MAVGALEPKFYQKFIEGVVLLLIIIFLYHHIVKVLILYQ